MASRYSLNQNGTEKTIYGKADRTNLDSDFCKSIFPMAEGDEGQIRESSEIFMVIIYATYMH